MPIDILLVTHETPRSADPLKVTFPCGGEVAAQFPSLTIPDGASLAKAMMGQANAALAPLAPIFKLLDAVLIGVELGKSLPELFVNPTKIAELIAKLVRSADALLKLVPQLSIPLMGLQLIDVIIAYLEGLVAMMQSLVRFQDAITNALNQSAQYPALLVVVEVSERNLDAMMESLEYGMEPTQRLMRFTNVFLSIAGLPALGDLSGLGRDPSAAIVPLQDAVRELRRIRDLIPV